MADLALKPIGSTIDSAPKSAADSATSPVNSAPEPVVFDDRLVLPPTQADLPYDDDTTMETSRHKKQMDLLIEAIELWLDNNHSDGFVGGNMFVHFNLARALNKDFREPDFFVALGVPRGERMSWVVWEEGKGPDVIIELLSESTAAKDKGEKKQVYQDQLRVPDYFWFDPLNPDDFAGFTLCNGNYEPILPNDRGHLVCQRLGLSLVRWHGIYRGVETTWLRWATLEGDLLPMFQEFADQAQQEAQQAQQEAQQAQQRADQAEQQLHSVVMLLLQQGMDIAQVSQLTRLSEVTIRQLTATTL